MKLASHGSDAGGRAESSPAFCGGLIEASITTWEAWRLRQTSSPAFCGGLIEALIATLAATYGAGLPPRSAGASLKRGAGGRSDAWRGVFPRVLRGPH